MHCQRVCKLQFKVTVEGAFLALTYVICLSSQLNAVYFQMAEGIAHVMQSLLLWEPLKTSSLLTSYCYARYYWYSWYSPFFVQYMLLQSIAYLQLKMVKVLCFYSEGAKYPMNLLQAMHGSLAGSVAAIVPL